MFLTAITVLATGVSSNAGATTQAAQASMFEMKCQSPDQDFKAHGKTMQNDVIFRSFFDSLSNSLSIFCPMGRATSRVVVFQVSCRGTGGDHSTSEPVDAEDGDIDTSWNQRGTNVEPTGSNRIVDDLGRNRNLRLWNRTIVSQHHEK